MLSFLKTKIYAIGVVLFALLLGLLKIQTERAKSWKEKAKKSENQLNFDRRQAKLDTEIEQEFSHRAELAKESLDDGEIPDHLRKPPRI